MKPNAKAFLLLLAVSAAAVELAVFVHERNVKALQESKVESQKSKVVSNEIIPIPAIPVTASSSSSTESHEQRATSYVPPTVFHSSDNVTEAVLEGYPSLGKTFTFYGTSTAFENQIAWRLRDAKRALLAEGTIYVHSPDAGTPGPFRETVSFGKTPATASGTLFIFEASAMDGTPIHIVSIPVSFATSSSL